MWGLLLLALFFSLLLWLLLAPITIEIDTNTHQYRVGWWGLASLSWHPLRDGFPVRYSIVGISREKRAEEFFESKPSKPKSKSKRRTSFRPNVRRVLRIVRRVLQSFRIKRCKLWLDTNDYCFNARLYPLIYALPGVHHHVTINFQGRTEVQFRAQNRLIRILYFILT